MNITAETVSTIVVAMFASTGFWALVNNVYQNMRDKKSVERQALLGLLHEQLMYKCNYFIKMGYISAQDFEDLEKYIYSPYRALGGNGTGERIWSEVCRLPMDKRKNTRPVEVERRGSEKRL